MSNDKKIVVVDNDSNYLSLVRESLLKGVRGSIVSCFLKAEDFLRVVEDCRPDLIISAYRLPDMTGV
jgi:two-component SAPR family response regulator